MLGKATVTKGDEAFFAISPLMIFPRTLGRFRVYIRQAGRYVLYAAAGEHFTPAHRQKLHDAGVAEVYIQASERQDYDRYIEKHLPQILGDEAVPVPERAQVLYTASQSVVRGLFESRLPHGLSSRDYSRVSRLVEHSLGFLAREEALRRIANLASHDYSVYTHNVHVFVYTTFILHGMKVDEHTQVQAGIGALLHDIGKADIPLEILSKPGPLTEEERGVINTHPVRGLVQCQDVPLSQAAGLCILLHHERMDGSGYPGGLSGERIPDHVRVLAVADAYDALTSNRVYAPAMTPFAALRLMRDEMAGKFDVEAFKRLVVMLSGAKML